MFSTVVGEIEAALQAAPIPSDEKEELKYVVSQATKKVEAWKAHLLRLMNQDEARLHVLENLECHSVLVVLDWAMKFLPRKYRESQADWFGKRGISWHIATAIRKSEAGESEMLTFVHVFQSCSQDSSTVIAIVDDVLKQLKSTMPEVNCVNFRMDNAGCYHSASTLLAVYQVANKYDIDVKVDFSDPQGGKGSCDRKAATIKNHMRMHLNSGNDVDNAEQMKNAIESSGGLPGVRVMLCSQEEASKLVPVKWEGVSLINNIEYGEEGVRVWRSYGIGPGKFLPWRHFPQLPESDSVPVLNIIKEATDPKATFSAMCARRKSPQVPSKEENTDQGAAETSDLLSENVSGDAEKHLFTCPEQGCVKSFQRHTSLEHHLEVGRHKYALERETLLDKAMFAYAMQLEHGPSRVENPAESDAASQPLSRPQPLPMGWALKSSTTQRHRLTEGQKRYLTEVFQKGEHTGHKADPDDVSKEMRKARNTDGSRLFQASEYLTSRQVTSFFSRLAAKKVVATESDPEDEDDVEKQSTERNTEKSIEELNTRIADEIGLQHPIMFERHNICDLAANSRLTKFSVKKLHDICSFFELHFDGAPGKMNRKKPYIDLLKRLTDNCSCRK